MLVSDSIPNLFNGVSQQPASLRSPTQGELQENAYSDVATGLRKRPPTIEIARLSSSVWPNAKVHLINRDSVERYSVIINNGSLLVHELNGTARTVAFPDGTAYLNATNSREAFELLTVADFTFIVNKTVTTAMAVTTAPGTLSGTRQRFSDLAAPTGSGQIWRIAGDPTNEFGAYYVIDSAAAGNVWVEHTNPGVKTTLDAATMPHILVRESGGNFTFRRATWDTLRVGDVNSAPEPGFIGRRIKDIFFHRNRLGVVADESFVLTRSGAYFNWFPKTVTAILDSDPIDRDISHTEVASINWAVPFNKSLLLVSDRTQFQVTAGDTMTPSNTRSDPTTSFESSTLCRPSAMGNSLYLAQAKPASTGLLEYFVDATTVTSDAIDVTKHVPTYIPAGAFKIAQCSNEDSMFVLTTTERNSIYTYKFFWNGDERIQSSWSRWVFSPSDTLLGMEFIGSVGYLWFQRAEGIFLESVNLQANQVDSGLPIQVLLDRRKVLTGVYDAVNDWTTWTLPHADSEVSLRAVAGSAFGGKSGTAIPSLTRPTSTTARAPGNWSAGICYVGRAYTMRYRFSELFMRMNQRVVQTGVLKIQRMTVVCDRTGYFRMEVTPKARATYTYHFNAQIVGDSTLILGQPTLAGGKFRFPVRSGTKELVIDIVNDSHLPCNIQSAEWDGEFVMFSRRAS
jgi:hypothetical protein